MSGTTLLQDISGTTTLDLNKSQTIQNAHGQALFAATGVGTGTWSATILIYPVLQIGARRVSDAPVTLSVSNAGVTATSIVNTPHCTYTAIVSALTGTCSVSAGVEG